MHTSDWKQQVYAHLCAFSGVFWYMYLITVRRRTRGNLMTMFHHRIAPGIHWACVVVWISKLTQGCSKEPEYGSYKYWHQLNETLHSISIYSLEPYAEFHSLCWSIYYNNRIHCFPGKFHRARYDWIWNSLCGFSLLETLHWALILWHHVSCKSP